MNLRKIGGMLLTILMLGSSAYCYGSPKPRWVKKGEKRIEALNKLRSNDSYSFHMFHTENADERFLQLDHFKPLYEYVANTYDVHNSPLALDTLPNPINDRTTYTVSFDKDGEKKVVYAQLVDNYTRLEDYVDNTFEYNLYELYAISEPGVTAPQFDEFSMSRWYNPGKATAMSIIPGLGQIYKDQKLKGFIFMGTEALLIAGIIYSNHMYHHYVKINDNSPSYFGNQMTTFKELRTFCIIGAAGLYVYNLFDAAFCKVAPFVKVERKNNTTASLKLAPTFDPVWGSVGVGLQYTF